jgi:hypothetical protein
MLSGCDWLTKPSPEIVYQEKYVPVSNVPKPPEINCPRPLLETTPTNASEGEIAKAYRISALQYRDCLLLYRKVTDVYDRLAEEDNARIERFNDNQTQSPTGPFSAGSPRSNPSTTDGTSFDEEALRRELGIDPSSTGPVSTPRTASDPFASVREDINEVAEKDYEIN